MKLTAHEEHHHGTLPEDPGHPERWFAKVGKKLLGYSKSPTGITVYIGLLTFALLTIILSLDYLAVVKLEEHDISGQDVFASMEIVVEDEAATRRAREDVPPVYRPRSVILESIRERQNHFFKVLKSLRADEVLTSGQKLRAFKELTNNAPEAPRYFNQLFENPAPLDWERMENLTRTTTRRLLDKDLAKINFVENGNELIQTAILTQGMTAEESDRAQFMVSVIFDPNLILDEQARMRAVRELKPVVRTFRKGQKIIDRGEEFTPVKIEALRQMGVPLKGVNWQACFGVMLLVAIYTATLWIYLYFYEERRFFKPTYSALVASLTIGTLGLLKAVMQNQVPVYAFPLATYALTVSIFTHPRIGILATTLVVFIAGLTMNIDFHSLSVLLFGSVVGIFLLSRRINFSDRGLLITAGFYVGVTNALMILAVDLLNPNVSYGANWNDFLSSRWSDLFTILGWGAICSGVLSGLLTGGILPYLEMVFRLVTPYTLMELGNHDRPLLKRMQFEAPGTFHHSIMVASLAEAAAEAIGANPLLTRVGCLYHDIGKMKRPLFFIENQAYFGVDNPHDKLTPRLSKMVVTAHPRDSLEMARQYRLPEVLTKFMTEHHGTLVAGYFYNQACIQEGVENVNKSQFRYPGPKPNIKETAIVMLADACESAVRALKNPTVAQIEERIDKIIRQRIDDGQFDNCPITFKDIHTIKATFLRVLRGIQHNRIEYQQNMMRELGRKIPTPESHNLPDLQQLADTLKQAEMQRRVNDGPSTRGVSSEEGCDGC